MIAQNKTTQWTVSQHDFYNRERPEAFNWTLVINPKVQDIAEDLATEIIIRRSENPEDPAIFGLREALRRIAQRAIWRTSVVQEVTMNPGEKDNGPDTVPDQRNHLESLHVSAFKAA